jgi:hypothetical protein
MPIRIYSLTDLIVKEPSVVSHTHEAANALVRVGIRNPIRILRRLQRMGVICATGEAIDAGSGNPTLRWAYPWELGLPRYISSGR